MPRARPSPPSRQLDPPHALPPLQGARRPQAAARSRLLHLAAAAAATATAVLLIALVPATAQAAQAAQAAEAAEAAATGSDFRLPPAAAPTADEGRDPGQLAPVTLERVRIIGAAVIPLAELEALAAPWLRRPLRAIDLEDLRQRITRAYVERGYINSGAVLDRGALQASTLTLRVIEGRVTQLRQKGLQRLTPAYLESRLLAPADVLDVRQLQERFELQLADPLFTRIQARLLPGDAPGEALLDLDVTRARPWQLALFANNYLAPAVGAAQLGAEGRVRNLLGWGDALALTLGRGEGTTNWDTQWQLPLLGTRTLLALRLARGASSVIEEPVSALDIDSVIATREATLSHPLLDEPRRRWLLGLTHARRSNRTTLGGVPFSFVIGEDSGTTRIESWRLWQELTLRLQRHVLALRAAAVSGRNNLATNIPWPGLAPRRYRLWQLQAQAQIALAPAGQSSLPGQQLVLRAQMQRSPDHLVGLEQLALGGRYTVRGYRENQIVRDNGFNLGVEWHWPLWRDEQRRASVTLLPFVEAGEGWDRGQAHTRLAAVGLGLAWTLADLEGEIHYARRLERRPIETHGNLQDHGIHLMLRWQPSF